MIIKPKQATIVSFRMSYFRPAKDVLPFRKCTEGLFCLEQAYNVFDGKNIFIAWYRTPGLFQEDVLKPQIETFKLAQEVMMQNSTIIGAVVKVK
jgi:hypothetical protein